MKNIIKSIVLISVLINNFTCKEDFPLKQQEYSMIITKEVESISDTGIVAVAEIIPNNQKVVEAGFIWSKVARIDVKSASKKLSTNISGNSFKLSISNDLCPNVVYYMKSYVKTSKYTYYGNTVVFTAKGSIAPVISDISPKEGIDGTNCVITGTGFSYLKENNILLFKSINVLIDSASDTKIYFTTPEMPDTGNVEFSVNANCRNTTELIFRIPGAIITEIFPAILWHQDTITLKGKNFNPDKLKIKVYLDEYRQYEIIYSDKNTIKAIVNQPAIFGERTLIIQSGSQKLKALVFFNYHPK